MSNRIYKVVTPAGTRLIQAPTKGQAIKHCVSGDYTAEIVNSSELYSAIQEGAKVEDISVNVVSETVAEEITQEFTPPAQPTAPVPVPQNIQPVQPQAGGGHLNPTPVAPVPVPQPPTAAEAVIQEQAVINPQAHAVAVEGVPPTPPSQGGPVDWDAGERAS